MYGVQFRAHLIKRRAALAAVYAIGIFGIVASGHDESTESNDPPPPPSSAAPMITGISPDPVVGLEHRQEIIITGTGFKANPTVTLTWTNQSGYELPAEHVTLISESEVEIRIKTTLEADNWTVKVTNEDGQSSNVYAFAVEAPVIALVDGFDYPIGDLERYTEDSDGDDWYTFVKFNEERKDENDNPTGKWHTGEDWNAEGDPNPNDDIPAGSPDRDLGQPVYAIANGTIVKAGAADVPGWGTVLIVRHRMPNDALVESVYGHVKDIVKTKGDVVRGEHIASIGKGGIGLDAHLHLEVRICNSDGICGNETGDSPNELFGHDTTQSPHGWTDPSEFIDAHRPTLTITDGEFAAWASFDYTNDDPDLAGEGPGTSTGTAASVATGGNPGEYLGTTTTVAVGDQLNTGAIKLDYELCHAGTDPNHVVAAYDPSDGAIHTLSVTADLTMFESGSSGWRLAVEQSGNIYHSDFAAFSGNWATATIDGLTAESFSLSGIAQDPSLVHPDFTENGDPIRLGVAISNRIQGGADGDTYEISHGVDNYKVVISRSPLFVASVDCPRVE